MATINNLIHNALLTVVFPPYDNYPSNDYSLVGYMNKLSWDPGDRGLRVCVPCQAALHILEWATTAY